VTPFAVAVRDDRRMTVNLYRVRCRFPEVTCEICSCLSRQKHACCLWFSRSSSYSTHSAHSSQILLYVVRLWLRPSEFGANLRSCRLCLLLLFCEHGVCRPTELRDILRALAHYAVYASESILCSTFARMACTEAAEYVLIRGLSSGCVKRVYACRPLVYRCRLL